MQDKTILDHINELQDEERALRTKHQEAGDGLGQDDRARLQRIETELDQAWDLLRQRRAREESGENPDEAASRSADEVESYLQ